MAEFTHPWSVIFSSKGAVKGKRTLDSGMGKKEKKNQYSLGREGGGGGVEVEPEVVFVL